MPPPTKLNETPAAWIRGAFGGRVVFIVESVLPFAKDVETMKLAAELPVGDESKQYWVFSVPNAFLDITGATFTVLQVNPGIKALGFNDYDDAEQQYENWALPDAGKPVKRGLAGLQQIGRED